MATQSWARSDSQLKGRAMVNFLSASGVSMAEGHSTQQVIQDEDK